MEINVYTLGHIAANCYTVLSADAALVIDPGQFSDAVANFLNQNDKKRQPFGYRFIFNYLQTS